MAEEDLPAEVRALIRDHLETYERLEILLLLHRHGGETCTTDWVVEQLKLGTTPAAEALDALAQRGLLRRVPGPPAGFRFAPGNAQLAAATEHLAATYGEQRLEVVKYMSSCAIERMRTAALRTFADAFVFKKKDDE
jgi:DNA-binding GntR family transcriptional regulator